MSAGPFYVLGRDGPALLLLTRREFVTVEEARTYAAGVHPDWRPFVVAAVDPV